MQADPPRVGFVAGTLGRGGAERQLYYMARALVAMGTPPRVLSLTAGESWEVPLRALGVPVEHVGVAAGRFRRLRAIRRSLRDDPVDIVQSAHFFTNLYATFAARRLRLPAIGAIRSDVTHELASHGWLGRRGLYWPRTLAANTQAAIETAVQQGVPRERLVHLPNVVDCSRFTPREPPGDASPEILFAGRLVRVKRLDRLVEVLASLPAEMDWRATIVGDGPERAGLEARLAGTPLAARVSLAGAVDDLRPFYARASVLLSTSDHEGSPNVVLEAMASGIPVVATSVGGVPELVTQDETGHHHAPQDVVGLARSLTSILASSEYARRLGAAARSAAEARDAAVQLPGMLESLYAHACR